MPGICILSLLNRLNKSVFYHDCVFMMHELKSLIKNQNRSCGTNLCLEELVTNGRRYYIVTH